MVLRPDSGDPVEVVLQALEAAEKVAGADVNSKGYKVFTLLSLFSYLLYIFSSDISGCFSNLGDSWIRSYPR